MKLQELLAQNSESNIRIETFDIYREYKKFPNRIQNDLSFSDYLDFHLEQQNRTGMAKRKYLELVQDLLANNQHKGVYKEFSIDQNHHLGGLEKEEQSTTTDLQPSHNHAENVAQGASFFVGELEVSFDKQVDEVGCT